MFQALIAAAMSLLLAGPSAAQSQNSPPGTVLGLFGGGPPQSATRTTQQLSTWFDLGAGFDKSVAEPGSVPLSRDYTATGTFRYWLGRTTRSFQAQARAYQTSNQAVDSAFGSEITTTGVLGAGQRTGSTLYLRLANESAQLYGAFGPGPTPPGSPDDSIPPVTDVSPPSGIVENRFLSMGGSASVFRRWTMRQRTEVQYQFTTLRTRLDESLSSNTSAAFVRHDWDPSSRHGFTAAYRFEAISQDFEGLPIEPIRLQSIQGGYRRVFRTSPIRAFTIALLGGVAQVQSVGTPVFNASNHVQPAVDVRASYNLFRRWQVSAGAGSGMTALSAVSTDAFNNHYASVDLAGVVSRRINVAIGTTYSRGAAVGVSPGTFVASNATATVQYGFRYGGVFAGLTRYRHELEEVLNPAGVIPPLVDRYSFRTGFTLWLPIFGAF